MDSRSTGRRGALVDPRPALSPLARGTRRPPRRSPRSRPTGRCARRGPARSSIAAPPADVDRDPRPLAEHDQRRADRPRRRRGRHLAPGDDRRFRPVPPAPAIVRSLHEVLCRLALEDLARGGEQRSVGETCVDGVLRGAERDVRHREGGTLVGDGDGELQRGIEQHRPLHELGTDSGQLGDEPPTEAVPDPRCPGETEAGDRLDQIVDVLGHPPRGQPRRAAVPAEVERDDAVLRERDLGQSAVALRVPRQPVERDDGAAALGPERDRVQLHSRTTFPNCSPESMRSCAPSASDRGRAVSTTGDHVPSSSMARSPAKSRGLPIVVPRSDTCPR